MKHAFITGLSAISPQDTFGNTTLHHQTDAPTSNSLGAQLPDFKKYIPLRSLRRMNRFTRMGVATAFDALEQARCRQPDAIIAATGLGCLEDTEKFLKVIAEGKEDILAPTSFITSTHNTLAGQLALLLTSDAYNFTYAHRGTAFENALIDGLMHIDEAEDKKIAIVATDELTPTLYDVLKCLKRIKQPVPTDVLHSGTKGIIPGEGACALVLEGQPDKAIARLDDVLIETTVTQEKLDGFLHNNGLTISDIDAVMTGINGDVSEDKTYLTLHENYFPDKPLLAFKHLCGEYPTANAFGTWLCANMLYHNCLFTPVIIKNDHSAPLKHLLLINHYKQEHYTLTLLRNV